MNKTKKDNLFITPKFKCLYAIISSVISLLMIIAFVVIDICKPTLISENMELFGYVTALYLIFIVLSMIIDEYIRKYPGLLVVICSSIYSLTYIVYCVLKGNITTYGCILITLFTIYVICSYFIYKYIYPKVVVINNAKKIFNTLYLMVVVFATIVIGTMYWL